jgi:2-methylcitrate dehydratase PrpD
VGDQRDAIAAYVEWREASARDPRRLALAALVRCIEDERCSASFPHAFSAVLRVTTRTGEELEARVEVNRGGPATPCPTRSWRGSSSITP